MLTAAGLFHRRKVVVTLSSLALNKDFERHPNDPSTRSMTGDPPAEVVAETLVDYNTYTMATYQTSATVHVDTIAYRSADMFQQAQSSTVTPGQTLFEAPVFDDQTTFHLHLKLTETDHYPRFSVHENLLAVVGINTDYTFLTYDMELPLTDQTIAVRNQDASATLEVQTIDMY
jgi:hypothetical protein